MALATELNEEQPERWWSRDTVAVVTGSNKGLGQAIVLEFAWHGVTVVSTARDAQQGAAVVERALKAEPHFAEFVHFRQLDITSEQSVAELAAWLQSTFGGLINNARIVKQRLDVYEDAEETVEVNYIGTRRVTEKLMPLLRASPHGPRILMITPQTSLLEAVDRLDKSILDSLVTKYLEDTKAGRATEQKWTFPHHYKESKLFLNTYSLTLAGELVERGGRPEDICECPVPWVD